jgi:hypothetical protein
VEVAKCYLAEPLDKTACLLCAFSLIILFARTRLKLLNRSNLHNKVLWLLVLNFIGSPVHPPLGALTLSKLGSSRAQAPPEFFVQEISHPSILSDQVEECNTLSQLESDTNDWREPIIRYIKNEEESNDKAVVERIARQSAHYTIIGGLLDRRGAAGALMKCIQSTTGKQLLDEIHAGQCGVHAASRTLVGKAFRSGFYWPTAKNDAAELVQKCEACQFLSKQQHLPAQQLQTIPVTWPFACWGLDMIGPFKKAQGGYTHILVAIDKFTKWIEYKSIASLNSAKAVEFIQDIIFRFGILNNIITDLGSNFTSSEFFDFCEQQSI